MEVALTCSSGPLWPVFGGGGNQRLGVEGLGTGAICLSPQEQHKHISSSDRFVQKPTGKNNKSSFQPMEGVVHFTKSGVSFCVDSPQPNDRKAEGTTWQMATSGASGGRWQFGSLDFEDFPTAKACATERKIAPAKVGSGGDFGGCLVRGPRSRTCGSCEFRLLWG